MVSQASVLRLSSALRSSFPTLAIHAAAATQPRRSLTLPILELLGIAAHYAFAQNSTEPSRAMLRIPFPSYATATKSVSITSPGFITNALPLSMAFFTPAGG